MYRRLCFLSILLSIFGLSYELSLPSNGTSVLRNHEPIKWPVHRTEYTMEIDQTEEPLTKAISWSFLDEVAEELRVQSAAGSIGSNYWIHESENLQVLFAVYRAHGPGLNFQLINSIIAGIRQGMAHVDDWMSFSFILSRRGVVDDVATGWFKSTKGTPTQDLKIPLPAGSTS